MRQVRRPFSAHLRTPRCTVCPSSDVQCEKLYTAEVSEMSCEVSEQENKTKQQIKTGLVYIIHKRIRDRIQKQIQNHPPLPLHCPVSHLWPPGGQKCLGLSRIWYLLVPAWAGLWCPTGGVVMRNK